VITWEKAPSCESGSCIEVGTSDESGLIWLGRVRGPTTREEFRAFVEQCKRGEWDHV
jgi:hypothetical protein